MKIKKLVAVATILMTAFLLGGCTYTEALVAGAQGLALMAHSEQQQAEMGGEYDRYASQRGVFFSKCLQEKGSDAAKGCQDTSEQLFPLPKPPEQINFVQGITRGVGRMFGGP